MLIILSENVLFKKILNDTRCFIEKFVDSEKGDVFFMVFLTFYYSLYVTDKLYDMNVQLRVSFFNSIMHIKSSTY